MSSGPKKTSGIVTHVTERFGFIELTNKNIPVSQVYFDFTSFEGFKGNDLSKIYPRGTTVSFTFVDSKGDHKVKHRAINLSMTQPRGPQGPQTHKERGLRHPPPSQGPRNKHLSREREPQSFQGRDRQGETSYPHEHCPHSGKSRISKPRREGPNRQNSREAGSMRMHGGTSGPAYPHENLYQPSEADFRSVEIPSNAGQILKQALASGLTKLAEKIGNQPVDHPNQPTEALTPQNTGSSKPEAPGKRRKGKKQTRTEQKAFSEPNSAEEKKPLQCSDDSAMNSQHAMAESFVSEAVPQLSQEPASGSRKKNRNRSKKGKAAEAPEATIFFNLLGKDLGVAMKNRIRSLDMKNMNNLLLLRLAVGKQPNMRIFNNGETSNHVIDDVKPVELEDLQRLLRHSDAVKTATPSHYGVKGTLHSIRSIEQNGKLAALTLFFQLHENHDGLGLEIMERKRFTAVVCDLETCPQKYLYNYLRCRSQEMAKSKDVLVLDIDGQLSGSDDNAHSSLGDVTRIACANTSEIPEVITGAMEHLHECVIVIGVDSVLALQALQKITTKGAQVIAEISPDIKSDAEALFSAGV